MNKVSILYNEFFTELAERLKKSSADLEYQILSRLDQHGVLYSDDIWVCGQKVKDVMYKLDLTMPGVTLWCLDRYNVNLNRLFSEVTFWGATNEDETCPDCGCGIDWERSDYIEKTYNYTDIPPETDRTVTDFVCSNTDCIGKQSNNLFETLSQILRPENHDTEKQN